MSTIINIFVPYITGTSWSRWEDRYKWRAVVNAVMNLRVSQVSANFLTEKLLVFFKSDSAPWLWRRVILDKLVVTQMFSSMPHNETRRNLQDFTTCPYPEPVQFTLDCHT